MSVILRNRIKCKKCEDIIESEDRHDFKYCKCNSVFVDGGKDYLRRGGAVDDAEELSVVISSFDTMNPEELNILMDDMQEWIDIYNELGASDKAFLGLYKRFTERWMIRVRELAARIKELEEKEQKIKILIDNTN